jgi:nicotinamide riboside transporter PnuC
VEDAIILNIEMLTYILSAVSIIGAFLNARKNRWGFVVWICGNFGWIVVDVIYEMYAQILVWIIFSITSIYGFRKWSGDDKKEAAVL